MTIRKFRNNGGLVFVAVLLAGCGTGAIRESTLRPSDFGSTDVPKIWAWDGKSGTGATIGSGVEPGEIFAGYEFHYENANVIQHVFRGGVRFDLGEIVALPSKSVEKAILSFKLTQSVVRDREGKSPEFVNLVSCASQLLQGNDDWTKLTGKVVAGATESTALIGGDLFAALPDTTPPGARFEFDVTPVVQRWVAKPEENFGWVLRGRKESFSGASNEACATRYREFSLDVRYRVF